jgi:hypothetical protein
MALYRNGEVEAIERELDEFTPKLTGDQFTRRRHILAEHIYPKYDLYQELYSLFYNGGKKKRIPLTKEDIVEKVKEIVDDIHFPKNQAVKNGTK